MAAVVFALVLAVLMFWLEQYSCVHSLDDVQGRLETEDYLIEAGQPVQLTLTIWNIGPHWKTFLALRLHLGREFIPYKMENLTKDRVGLGHTVRRTTWLRPHQKASFEVPVCIQQRGRYVLEPLQVIGGDFLGLKEQSHTERGFHELIVPPRECEAPDLKDLVGGFLGSVSVNRYLYEDPVLTAGCREYASGDPMRAISWKQSARGLGLMVKTFDYTTEPRVVVLVHADTARYTQPERVERCYSMARTVCRILEDKAVSYRFALNATFDLLMNATVTAGGEWKRPLEVSQGYGPEHYRRVLEMLGRATGQAAQPCAEFCARYYHPQEQTSCIFLTTEPEETASACLNPMPGMEILLLTPESWNTAAKGETAL